MKLNLKHFITSIVSAVLLTALFGSFAALAADGTLTLTADADITEDSGISVITPSLTVNGEQITDFEGIRYSLDSICAKPAANDDGTLSLSGRINGEVSVGAAFTYDGVTYTAEPVSVTVSGQYDRISAKKVKVVAFGNSITTHPTLDDWTSSGQGMAADSLSQDYVHVFTSQLEDKYGEGNVSLAIKGAVSFERAMDTASTTTDWSSFLADDAKYVEEQQPDIIVLQMGENCFTSSVPADYVNVYRHAMESFVNIMRQKAPDATILLVSSTWGATVNGVISAAKNVDVPYVRSDIIYQMEGSKASEDNYGGTNGGIGAHPGNLGHERMGLAAYESINLYLTTML
ncbi:MAG: SGNH/GDSL hydrolase family protein, partial [Clostridia bacterium]|nr:SGNH/GDSL hydrolase family protein [Clostridia bacterium]